MTPLFPCAWRKEEENKNRKNIWRLLWWLRPFGLGENEPKVGGARPSFYLLRRSATNKRGQASRGSRA